MPSEAEKQASSCCDRTTLARHGSCSLRCCRSSSTFRPFGFRLLVPPLVYSLACSLVSVLILIYPLVCSVDSHCPHHVCCPDETATPPRPNDACTATFPRRRSRCVFLYSRLVYHRRSRSWPRSSPVACAQTRTAIERANHQSAPHSLHRTRILPLDISLSE